MDCKFVSNEALLPPHTPCTPHAPEIHHTPHTTHRNPVFGHFVRWFVRSFIHSFARSVVRSYGRSLVRSLARLFALVRSLFHSQQAMGLLRLLQHTGFVRHIYSATSVFSSKSQYSFRSDDPTWTAGLEAAERGEMLGGLNIWQGGVGKREVLTAARVVTYECPLPTQYLLCLRCIAHCPPHASRYCSHVLSCVRFP